MTERGVQKAIKRYLVCSSSHHSSCHVAPFQPATCCVGFIWLSINRSLRAISSPDLTGVFGWCLLWVQTTFANFLEDNPWAIALLALPIVGLGYLIFKSGDGDDDAVKKE